MEQGKGKGVAALQHHDTARSCCAALAAALLCILALSWAGSAAAGEWRLAPEASRLGFTATVERLPLEGRFGQYEAGIRFDPRRPEGGRLLVTVALASVEAGSADVNGMLASPAWLDTTRHPTATYRAETIDRTGADSFTARGTLTLKGVTRPFAVPFTWKEEGGAARLTGEAMLRRHDFGVGDQGGSVGPEVRVVVDLTLTPGVP